MKEFYGLNGAARALHIRREDLANMVFECGGPPFRFDRDHNIRFRWTDLQMWQLSGGYREWQRLRQRLYQ